MTNLTENYVKIVTEDVDIDFDDFKDDGWEGIDASLDISLGEYGLLAKKQDGDNYKVIYGVGADDHGNYNEFAWSWKSESEMDSLINANEWLDEEEVDSFLDTNGTTKEEWLALDPIMKLYDLYSYFNYLDIFGDVVNSESAEDVYDWLKKNREK